MGIIDTPISPLPEFPLGITEYFNSFDLGPLFYRNSEFTTKYVYTDPLCRSFAGFAIVYLKYESSSDIVF